MAPTFPWLVIGRAGTLTCPPNSSSGGTQSGVCFCVSHSGMSWPVKQRAGLPLPEEQQQRLRPNAQLVGLSPSALRVEAAGGPPPDQGKQMLGSCLCVKSEARSERLRQRNSHLGAWVKWHSTGLSLGLSLLASKTGPCCLPCTFS